MKIKLNEQQTSNKVKHMEIGNKQNSLEFRIKISEPFSGNAGLNIKAKATQAGQQSQKSCRKIH